MGLDTGDGDQETPSEAGGGSLTFVPNYDFVEASRCDSFLQDCEVGEKCVPYGSTGGNWDANKCVPVLGDGKVGEPCTYDGVTEATDSCDATSMCWNVGDVDGEAIGTCTAFCTGTADDPSCPIGSSCSISCDGSLSVCNLNCDPLLQDCLGTGCYWANVGFQCVFTTSNLQEGEACGFINDCTPGLICVSAEVVPNCEGSACCAAFCSLSVGAGGCAIPGTECLPFFEAGMALPGYEDIGICMVPPE
ncbi:ribulose phosphate epimerase [Enhygromyxa salina]|uniref:ribulose phosphate epimerase n=1 Tax=Enhygromyxa salina TaxID=215803 RepID=UPI001FD4DCC1|nr:ribulose phosphate epimerase [Enhygromyxa salina]